MKSAAAGSPLLSVENLTVRYPKRDEAAVDDVSFKLVRGETLGLVGESGSGKSSVARAILQLPRPTSGSVVFDGIDLTAIPRRELRALRPRMQMMFQDSLSALNPRRSVKDIVLEGPRTWRRGTKEQRQLEAGELLSSVGIDPGVYGDRRPAQLSGGQRQRVGLARALALAPDLLVCDEPVSALDVSIQAQILELLARVQGEQDLTMLFISHDLAVVRYISDQIGVMYRGRLCEFGATDSVLGSPRHHYTAELLASVPEVDRPPRPSSSAAVSPPADKAGTANGGEPDGCPFAHRCPAATGLCRTVRPSLARISEDDHVACHHPRTNASPTG
jgi:peptide/nickel transport system ATP-binding protein